MKILITESQLDKVIDSYLKNTLSGEFVREHLGSREIFWFLNHRVIFITRRDNKWGEPYISKVDSRLTFDLEDMFGIDQDTAEGRLKDYITKNILNKKS